MNAAPHDIDQVRERASLYALGALGDDEARAFEAHLNANCSLCTSELAAFSAVVDEVARQTPPQTPPTALRARVLERVAGDAERTHPQSLTKEGLLFAYSNRIPWTALPFPGLDIKVLSTDETKATSTQLVRMQPGATYPSHRHAATEELFLLEGDLTVSGVLMQVGDFCRAELGSVHTGISTRQGCLFLSSTSLHDELFA